MVSVNHVDKLPILVVVLNIFSSLKELCYRSPF